MTVTCSNCGAVRDEHAERCPKCGDTRRTFHEEKIHIPIHSSVTVRSAIRRIRTEIKKNWRLITVLIICDVLSTIPAYFLSGWWSVLVTVLFILFSTVVGYFAITRMITITIES